MSNVKELHLTFSPITPYSELPENLAESGIFAAIACKPTGEQRLLYIAQADNLGRRMQEQGQVLIGQLESHHDTWRRFGYLGEDETVGYTYAPFEGPLNVIEDTLMLYNRPPCNVDNDAPVPMNTVPERIEIEPVEIAKLIKSAWDQTDYPRYVGLK